MPHRGLQVNKCEIQRAFKVLKSSIEPISFVCPRKAGKFQEDLYPPCRGTTPSQSIEEYMEGTVKPPILIDLKEGYVPQDKEFVVQESKSKEEQKILDFEEAYNKLSEKFFQLEKQVQEKDIKIRQLEARLSS